MASVDSSSASAVPVSPPSAFGRRWRWGGLALLLAAFAANHLEYVHRAHAASIATGVVVRAEGGVFAGHNTIGVDESRPPAEGTTFLRFALLETWAFDPSAPTPPPDAVKQMDGATVDCIGFMYPLEAGAKLKTFCLLRTTQTCCYGPRPQWNQYLLAEMASPVKFERLAPVIVRGVFRVDPQSSQGFIYRIEGTSITSVSEDEPDVDPAEAARRAKLPLFDFSALEAARSSGDAPPPALLALDGKRVAVAGWFLNRVEAEAPRVLVAKSPWDGATRGKRPGLFDAVPAYMPDASSLPPVWKEKGILAGILRVERRRSLWRETGVVRLENAKRLTPGLTVDRGPLLGIGEEVVILVAFLWLAFRRKRESDPTGVPA